MKIFFDTNVILDWLLDRTNNYAFEATELINFAIQKQIEIYISSGSMFTIAYVLERSGKKGETLKALLTRILELFKIQSTDETPFQLACQSKFKDMEDAFQYEIAMFNNNLNYFVTGNLKEFRNNAVGNLPVITPKQMLKLLA
ncbi:MAG: PIN domain-containing protein [Bacteroidota bacterium]